MVTMRVIKSNLPGGGVVRIPEEAFVELRINPGDSVRIEAPLKGSFEAVALADSIYTVNGIRIRPMDLEKLGVLEGDGVMVTPASKGLKEEKKG